METLDLILFLIILIILIIIGYYLYKGLSTFGNWLGGSLEDLIKKIEAPFKEVYQVVESGNQTMEQYTGTNVQEIISSPFLAEAKLEFSFWKNLIDYLRGNSTTSDIVQAQEQNQKVIIPPVNRYYYTTG